MPNPSTLAAEDEAAGYVGGHDPEDYLGYESSAACEKRKHPVYFTLDHETITGIAYEVAGAVSVPFMQAHPHFVFPSEEVREGVLAVLRNYGIEPAY